MSERYDPRRGLVIVGVRLHGPQRPVDARLLLDTGSLLTMLRPSLLERLGYAISGALPFDGLLGANFMRGRQLTVDYREGTARLDRAKRCESTATFACVAVATTATAQPQSKTKKRPSGVRWITPIPGCGATRYQVPPSLRRPGNRRMMLAG